MRSIFYGRQILRWTEIVPDGKQVDIQASLYFFLRHSKKFGDFFYKVGRFSVKNSSRFLENNPHFPTKANKQIFIFTFFLYYFSRKEKNLCRDPLTIEYIAHGPI